MVGRILNWVTRGPLGRRMSSYSCVTARLTMRSVLQTHGDNRSRSGPVIRLVPRPSMAPMLLAMASTHKQIICNYIYAPAGEPSVGNPHSVGRRPKKQKVRARLLTVTTTGGDPRCEDRSKWRP